MISSGEPYHFALNKRTHGVAEPGRDVHVAGGQAVGSARVAVGHGNDDRLLQTEHVAQLGMLAERFHDRQLGGAGVAEQVLDALVAEQAEKGGAARDVSGLAVSQRKVA